MAEKANPVNKPESREAQEARLREAARQLLADYEKGRPIDNMHPYAQPDSAEVLRLTDDLVRLVYPGYLTQPFSHTYSPEHFLGALIEDCMIRLVEQVSISLRYHADYTEEKRAVREGRARELVAAFFARIPEVRQRLQWDLEATYDGDPAAVGYEEIVLAYPGLYAITVNRLAHELFLLKVPLIPRIMTEYAHRQTGIDIHPGGTIGKYFCIDHGTGIVVGETTVIGDHVKVYQGVTLGALSTRGGQSLRGKRRHPTIEDNVTIYAGASILGGETVIGQNSVIGSNVFLTRSVAPNMRVTVANQELNYKPGEGQFE